jgi:hypothetical protein
MTPRRQKPRVPACPRCGNEEDLAQWVNGVFYCQGCLTCKHGMYMRNVCVYCVRRLHTVLTFEGPRISDIEYYVEEAWREYGLQTGQLFLWTFEEEEMHMGLCLSPFSSRKGHPGVTVAPPHHRF